MSTKHQSSIIKLEEIDPTKKDNLFSSAKNVLSLTNTQFYNPYFEFVDSNTDINAISNQQNTCLNSKYKLVNIEFIIDSDNEYDDLEDDESTTSEQPDDSYVEKLPIAEEDIDELPQETKELVKRIQTQDHLDCKMRASTDDDKILNCFPIMASIEKMDTKTNTIKTYKQKIFCKRSPLLEPLKIILNEHAKITPDTDISNLNNELLTTTANKINSIHNSSHVEAFGLYCLSKLTETGACPTFPYYFGCLNGISNIYYHNITDEISDLYKKKWFIDKTHNGEIELIYVDLDSSSNGSDSQSNSSIDIDDILKRSFEKEDINDTSSIDEEITELTDIIQKRIEALDNEDKSGEAVNDETDKSVEAVNDETDKSGEAVNDETEEVKTEEVKNTNTTINEKIKQQSAKKQAPKIVYPETDEYNFDGFDIEVQQGGDNTIEDPELEEELNMDTIINMRDFLENKVFFAKFRDMPVNYCFMERLDETLDDLLESTEHAVSEEELLSILFQVAFGLAVANKCYSFVHNDLHSDNILFQSTKEIYIYYGVKETKTKETETVNGPKKSKYKYYRIPTFGKVSKIIDFARATFKINNKWIFSDVFMPNGEAAGQYKFPDCPEEQYWGEDFIGADEPNPSFDLARLARSIKHQVHIKSVYNLLKKWSKSDDGSNMLDKEDDFELYVDIAKNCHNAVPKNVLQDKIFKKFEIAKEKIPKEKHIYML